MSSFLICIIVKILFVSILCGKFGCFGFWWQSKLKLKIFQICRISKMKSTNRLIFHKIRFTLVAGKLIMKVFGFRSQSRAPRKDVTFVMKYFTCYFTCLSYQVPFEGCTVFSMIFLNKYGRVALYI